MRHKFIILVSMHNGIKQIGDYQRCTDELNDPERESVVCDSHYCVVNLLLSINCWRPDVFDLGCDLAELNQSSPYSLEHFLKRRPGGRPKTRKTIFATNVERT